MSQTTPEQLTERLRARFRDKIDNVGVAHAQATIQFTPADLVEVCTALRDEADRSEPGLWPGRAGRQRARPFRLGRSPAASAVPAPFCFGGAPAFVRIQHPPAGALLRAGRCLAGIADADWRVAVRELVRA